MTIPKGLEDVLSVDPEVMHGSLCFVGTRVPLTVLLDNLAEGMGIDEFTEEYPSVSREQALAVIAWQQNETRHAAGLELVR
jgi:uncharacterized protein (DUF433 family)